MSGERGTKCEGGEWIVRDERRLVCGEKGALIADAFLVQRAGRGQLQFPLQLLSHTSFSHPHQI